MTKNNASLSHFGALGECKQANSGYAYPGFAAPAELWQYDSGQ